jgi:hypothetical protein
VLRYAQMDMAHSYGNKVARTVDAAVLSHPDDDSDPARAGLVALHYTGTDVPVAYCDPDSSAWRE